MIYYPNPSIRDWLGSLLRFNWGNWPNDKLVRHRGEEVVIPWTGSSRMGEQVLRARIDGLSIPYEEKYDRPEISPPDLSRCTRLDIRYQPSVLDYFFPSPNERVVMSTQEAESLRSAQNIIVEDREHIQAVAHEIAEKGLIGGIVVERSTARVVCHRDDERLASFTIYDDRAIVTEDEQCIRYSTGLPTLMSFDAQVR
jgi:hypothetical protein